MLVPMFTSRVEFQILSFCPVCRAGLQLYLCRSIFVSTSTLWRTDTIEKHEVECTHERLV